MPKLALNPTTEEMRGVEYDLGSLPVGSFWQSYNCAGVLVLEGYLLATNASRCIVVVTGEGDGNFFGTVEAGTLQRIHTRWQEMTTMQQWLPVVWGGVDEDILAALEVPIAPVKGSSASLMPASGDDTTGTSKAAIPDLIPVIDDFVPKEGDE